MLTFDDNNKYYMRYNFLHLIALTYDACLLSLHDVTE